MTPDQFQELCSGTARLLDCTDADALLLHGTVTIDGVHLGVFHREDADPTGVFCCVDLGKVGPQVDAHGLMQALMGLNLALDGRLGEVIGMEPGTGHLVLRARLDTANGALHEGRLAWHLRGYAALANELYEKVLVGVERPA